MKTDILTNGSMVKNHISLETGFGYSAIRRTSFRSWFQACHRVLPPVPSRQEIDHPKSSSSSSTSPPMTSSTVSSESVVRQARLSMSSEHVERKERAHPLTKSTKIQNQIKKRRPRVRTGRPVLFRNTGMAARIQGNSCG